MGEVELPWGWVLFGNSFHDSLEVLLLRIPFQANLIQHLNE